MAWTEWTAAAAWAQELTLWAAYESLAAWEALDPDPDEVQAVIRRTAVLVGVAIEAAARTDE